MKAVFILMAYLIGSIPIGVILSSFVGKEDIRKKGSGNIGATNVFRVHGKKLGVLTLAGDALKGAIPVLAAMLSGLGAVWVSLVALAVFLGHLYPVFLSFKGGKGVATAMGIFLVISPVALIMSAAIFLALVYKYRYVSLGSLAAAAVMPVLIGLINCSDYKIYMIFSLCISALIFYKHKANIERLLNKEELKI
jgi:glycerol-3-phosphate acyltransferase PlsY